MHLQKGTNYSHTNTRTNPLLFFIFTQIPNLPSVDIVITKNHYENIKKSLGVDFKIFALNDILVVLPCFFICFIFIFNQISNYPSTNLIITKNLCEKKKKTLDTSFKFSFKSILVAAYAFEMKKKKLIYP